MDDIALEWLAYEDTTAGHNISLFFGSSLDPNNSTLTYQDADYIFEEFYDLTPLGDIDGDGQDDVAVLYPYTDIYASNDGMIGIFSACEN